MKSRILIRVQEEDMEKISEFSKKFNDSNDAVIIPQGEHIKVYVIKDNGEVTELK
jgi:hypothetical protein